MSQNKGFKDNNGIGTAINEFKRGMRVRREEGDGDWFVVVHVFPNGYALAVDRGTHTLFSKKGIYQLTLDLFYPWEERRYKNSTTGEIVEVVAVTAMGAVSPERVTYRNVVGDTTATRTCSIHNFLEAHSFLLNTVNPPDPGSDSTNTTINILSNMCQCCNEKEAVHNVDGGLCAHCFIEAYTEELTWKPEAGKECLFLSESVGVVCVGPDPDCPGNYICAFYNNGMRNLLSVLATDLRPLPPEPPVKVGDRVEVKAEGNDVWYIGYVRHAWTDSFDLEGWPGSVRTFAYKTTTITKLVPVKEDPRQ